MSVTGSSLCQVERVFAMPNHKTFEIKPIKEINETDLKESIK